MKNDATGSDGSRGEEQPRRTRGRVIRALIVVSVAAAVCGAYAFYVMRNLESLAARDLRSLATLTSQIESTIAADRTTLRDYAHDPDEPGQVIPDERSPREYNDFEILQRHAAASPAAAQATTPQNVPVKEPDPEPDPREIVRQQIDFSGGKARLALRYEGVQAKVGPSGAVEGQAKVGASGVVDLSRLIQPFFTQEFLSIFDQVLMTRPDGKVVFATAPRTPSPLPVPHATRTDFRDHVSVPNGAIVVTDLASFSERVGLHKWQGLNVAALRGASRRTEVRVMEREYYLFTQPLRFTTEDCVNCVSPPEAIAGAAAAKQGAKPDAKQDDANELLICALVPKGEFRSQAMAIPAPVFTMAAGILLFLACCWPFIRIVRLRDREPLTPPDVVLAALAALVGGAILALAVSDTRIFRRLSGIEDKHLATYAQKLRADFVTDLLRVAHLAEHLRDTAPTGEHKDQRSRFMKGPRAPQIWRRGPVWRYPYFSGGMWVHPDGRAVVLDAAGEAPPVTNVSGRHFFHELRANHWSTVREFWPPEKRKPRTPHRYIAEIVRTRDSHLTILAVPPSTGIDAAAPRTPIFAVIAPFIHFVDPVVPPGFRFAVIDDRGTVLFHSDRQRSLTENFFRETDDDRHLRSAFFARRDQQIDGRYWGVDHQMYVAPIPDSPWAVVAMRDESLLRSVNTEIMAMTVLLLTLYAVLYAFAFALLAVFKPKYRAPWLWPHADLESDYAVTICVLTIEVFALVASMLFLAPGALLVVGFVGPVRGIATAYIVMNATREDRARLKREGHGRYWWIGVAASTVLTFLWLYAIGHSSIEPGLTRTIHPYVYKTALVVAVVAAFTLSLVGRKLVKCFVECVQNAVSKAVVDAKNGFRRHLVGAERVRGSRPKPGWLRAYEWTGFLMIVIGAVLPALTFLKVASRIGVEARVKWSQLELAGMLERRINLLERISLRDPRIAHDCYGIPHVLDAIWTLDPRATTERPATYAAVLPRSPGQSALDLKCEENDRAAWVPAFLQTLLPRYSESSVAMRELHHEQTTDGEWRWCRNGNLLTLRKSITLEPEAAHKLYGTNSSQQFLVVQSLVPRLLGIGAAVPKPKQNCSSPSTEEEDAAQGYSAMGQDASRDVLEKRSLWTWFRRSIYVMAIIVAVYVLRSAMAFMARRVFLVDTQEALWLKRDRKIQPGPATHLFVTHTKSAGELVSEKIPSIGLTEVAQGNKTWVELMREIDAIQASDIVIPDFEVGLDDEAFAEDTLGLLEELLDSRRHTLIVLSRVSAATILSRESGSLRERWAKVIDSFLCIDESLLLKRDPDATTPTHDHGDELCGPFHLSEVPRRVLERDWADCSSGEKLTLYQLAEHGLTSGRNARFVESLLSRHFICRTPALRVCCWPFHDFVLRAGSSERLDVQPFTAGTSVWERLRLPLVFLAVVIISLVVTTQQDIINATSAIITGLAAGLPALIKLVAILTGKSSADADGD